MQLPRDVPMQRLLDRVLGPVRHRRLGGLILRLLARLPALVLLLVLRLPGWGYPGRVRQLRPGWRLLPGIVMPGRLVLLLR